ncbi:uncharacterized protein EV420DRAFT_548470 [Desarmillaria tabescens]|uniref:Uncharacterized protein n=1 Tax=Armillaria tabescens TaxID=1929756 RepID=A0AA39MFX4_ARMTA|nr:uncharacterized protein EV420DRAFT_548470 [Desarmillaria tabescens]KAK0433381.1 hypothetical protein EV420DRAFT_548470 [Desarmillaria tabescens]
MTGRYVISSKPTAPFLLLSIMMTQADILPDLTNEHKAYVFQELDAELNTEILYTLLHGIYTGIVAVTLWNIFINKCWMIRRALVIVIVLLYGLNTINVVACWSYTYSAFIENGQSFSTVYLKLTSVKEGIIWEVGIISLLSTILADSYIIWCCWMLWGRRQFIVLLPILCLISATGKVSDLVYFFHISNFCVVSKIFDVHHVYFNATDSVFLMVYLSSTLATTLWCTMFIIFRILTVTGVRRGCGAGGRLRAYYCFLEVLVESSALYSIALVLFLAFFIHNDFGQYYLDVTTAIMKGVAPTLLVGRAAAGHTRPTEEHDERIHHAECSL